MRFSGLLAIASAVALFPSVSFAQRPQCSDICWEYSFCTEPCYMGSRWASCGEAADACIFPDSVSASSSDELAATCADCATERTSCLQRVKRGDIEEVQACMDAYAECSQMYCVSSQ